MHEPCRILGMDPLKGMHEELLVVRHGGSYIFVTATAQCLALSLLRYDSAYFHVLGPNFERPDLSQIRDSGQV